MGGKKGKANLIHAEKALIGAGTYQAMSQELLRQCGKEFASRRKARTPPPPFEAPRPQALNEVWAADLFSLTVWGIKWEVSVVQDLYNQERLAFEPSQNAADAEQVQASFEVARIQRGGQAPTICTKTDRDARYTKVFKEGLAGLCKHVRIPPGCPWYNGEIERGQRDNRDVLIRCLADMPRPTADEALTAMRIACNQASRLLNETISRPSLGNVTPAEIANGQDNEVRERNRKFTEQARQVRQEREQDHSKRKPWGERIADVLDLSKWSTGRLLKHIRLATREYGFLAT